MLNDRFSGAHTFFFVVQLFLIKQNQIKDKTNISVCSRNICSNRTNEGMKLSVCDAN